MLGEKGFDVWADRYDESVDRSNAKGAYPFAGYDRVMDEVFSRVKSVSGGRVLDLGFGTATLTSRLYEAGYEIYGQDFSDRMVKIAQEKMPKALLCKGNLVDGVVAPLRGRRYDAIVATYSLHHLDDSQKVALIRELTGLLVPGGAVHIGDVAFETRKELEECRRLAGSNWDADEVYFVFDELRPEFPELNFTRVSPCAGVLTLTAARREQRLRCVRTTVSRPKLS